MAIESFVLNVVEVIEETVDAKSVVFEVPEELQEHFGFTPGQFLTLAVPSERTGLAARCYSLSSTPHSGQHKITVKRTVDGYASNWIHDHLKPGDNMRVLPPSGIFSPKELDDDHGLDTCSYSRPEVERIARRAFELARQQCAALTQRQVGEVIDQAAEGVLAA